MKSYSEMPLPKTKSEAIKKGKELLPEAGDKQDAYFAAAALLKSLCGGGYVKDLHFEPIRDQLKAWRVAGLAGRTIQGAASSLGLAPKSVRKSAAETSTSATTSATTSGSVASVEALVERLEGLQVQFSQLARANVAEFAQIGDNAAQLAAFMSLSFRHQKEPEVFELPESLSAFFE